MCSEAGFHYRALFEYKKDRGDDISLQPGDILTVNKAALVTSDYQEGDERSPRGWLSGTNERTKDNGDFPGTYVEYVGPVRVVPTNPKPRPRPVPPTPVGTSASGPSQAGRPEGVDRLRSDDTVTACGFPSVSCLESLGCCAAVVVGSLSSEWRMRPHPLE